MSPNITSVGASVVIGASVPGLGAEVVSAVSLLRFEQPADAIATSESTTIVRPNRFEYDIDIPLNFGDQSDPV
ncbi:hypothetical protein LBMAG12_18030 [Actinomycetes bacterium]|nr:hypothetical protein LBMAG12_18030 [Actinomycetes bacterium]